jgi:hypothetical protein
VPNSTFYDNSSSLDLIIYADVWTPINNFDDIRTLVADQTDVKAFLTNDIIFDGTTDWGTPISYSGVFDGRMHKIENLNFKYYGASCAPFMLGFQSTMKNIKIYNPVLSGTTAWSSDSKRISLFWSRVSNNSEPINSVYYQNIQVFGGNISGSGWTNKSVFDAHMMTSSAANNIYNISNYVLVNMSNLNSGLWDAIRSTTIGNTINVTQNIITSNTSGSICGAGNSTGSETTTVNTNGLIWDSQLNTKSRFNSGYNSNFKINDTSGTVSGVNTATAKNESTYIDRGFDFNYVWKLDQENNGYPSLRIPVTIHRD